LEKTKPKKNYYDEKKIITAKRSKKITNYKEN
jgi:hypothetical protein